MGRECRFLELEGGPQRRRDGQRDFILDREQVAELALVRARPEMSAVGGRDELGGHAYAVAGPADAALEHVRDLQLAGDLRDIQFLVAECE